MTRHLIIFSLLINLLLLPFSLKSAEISPNFDNFVKNSMKTWSVPGTAIAIVKDDQIIYMKGFGVKEEGKSAPINPHTDFAIASGTKSFTATAIAMLVEEGKIQWDDPIVKYLPNIRFYNDTITKEMTFRDLLSHKTNLVRDDALWHETNYSKEEVLTHINELQPFTEKKGWNYNNLMYAVAGEIIPTLTGQSWDQFIKDRILRPLGMKNTNTSINSFKGNADVAMPHKIKEGKPYAIAWKNVDNIAPAIAINSNAYDMAQWVRFQLAKGKFNGKQLLSSTAVEETHGMQTIIPDSDLDQVSYPNAQVSYYGLGWRMHNYHGNRVIEHEGMIDGMTSLVAMLPEQNIGIIILTNQDVNLLPTAVMYRAFDTLLNIPTQDWNTDLYEKYTALTN